MDRWFRREDTYDAKMRALQPPMTMHANRMQDIYDGGGVGRSRNVRKDEDGRGTSSRS